MSSSRRHLHTLGLLSRLVGTTPSTSQTRYSHSKTQVAFDIKQQGTVRFLTKTKNNTLKPFRGHTLLGRHGHIKFNWPKKQNKIEYTVRYKRHLKTLKCLWILSTHITTNCESKGCLILKWTKTKRILNTRGDNVMDIIFTGEMWRTANHKLTVIGRCFCVQIS